MPCSRANASARSGSRAATATTSASGIARAGTITAAGAMRAAPRMPMRTGSTAREVTQRARSRESDQPVVGLHQRDDEHNDDADPDAHVERYEPVALLEPLRVA